MGAADASISNTRRQLALIENAAADAGRSLDRVKLDSAQAFQTAAVADAIRKEVSNIGDVASRTADYLADVKLRGSAAVETRLAADSEVDSLQKIERQALKTRAAVNGGGSGGGGMLAGLLPGGARPGPAAVAALAGLGIATAPVLLPAAAGLAAGGAAAAGATGGALLGGLLVLREAVSGLTKALTDAKAFAALDPQQKQLAMSLRQLQGGLGSRLEGIVHGTATPGLNQELHMAMSPSTVQALTVATTAFSGAVAAAAKSWGAFFGSSSFGSQLQQIAVADSRVFKSLSDDMQHVADMALHLSVAAIPLVDRMTQLAGGALRNADAWVRNAQASGQLASMWHTAAGALSQVWNLVEALGSVFAALYRTIGASGTPVMNLLIGALNEIATVVNQNKAALSSFFVGAAGAVKDLLAVVRDLNPVLQAVLTVIDQIAKDLGGWRVVIDGVIAFMVARFLIGKLAADSLAASLLGVGPAAVKGAATADGALASVSAEAAVATGTVDALRASLLGVLALGAPLAALVAMQGPSHAKNFQGTPGGAEVYEADGKWYQKFGRAGVRQITAAQAAAMGATAGGMNPTITGGGNTQAQNQSPQRAAAVAAAAAANAHRAPTALVPGTHAWYMKYLGYDPTAGGAFGTPPPFTTGLGGGGGGGALNHVFNASHQAALAAAQTAFAQNTGPGTTPKQQEAAALKYLDILREQQTYLKAQAATGKDLVAKTNQLKQIQNDINAAKREEAKADKEIAQAQIAAKERGILGIAGSNSTATVLSLRSQAAALGRTITTDAAKGIDTTAVEAQLAKIRLVLKNNFVPPDVRQAITSQFATIKQAIQSQLSTALEDAKEQLSTAQAAFKSAFTQIANAADSAFQRNTQKALSAMQVLVNSPLGKFLFGGSITQTPAGQMLAALQEQHTMQGLQDNLKSAQDAVAAASGSGPGTLYDAATGIYSSLPGSSTDLAAAQKQLADAQFAIQEHTLQQQDAIEQTAAQQQLADAKAAYQDQQALAEQAMNQQVDAIEQGMESGAIAASDGFDQLKKIWATNGIDLGNLAFAMGGTIYTGLANGLAPIFDMLKTLVDDLNRVAGLTGDKSPNAPSIAAFTPPGMRFGPLVPMAAGGAGRVNGPTLFLAGEKGAEDFAFSGGGRSFGGGGGGDVVVQFTGDVYGADANELASMVRDKLLILARRNGNSAFGGLA